ncbi:MAG: histidine phosphatase family protein [Chloroflexota bacterium]
MDDQARGRTLTAPDDDALIPDGLDATLVLVRHGESTLIAEGRFQGRADSPLTEIGRRQAGLVAVRLAAPRAAPVLPVPTGPPVEIVHSPLGRATETAHAIDVAMRDVGWSVATRPDDGFPEIGQGDWQGLHRDEIAVRYAAELAAWRRTPLEVWAPGGEALPEVEARVRPSLARILATLAEGRAPGTLDRSQVSGYGDPAAVHPWSVVVGHDGVFKIVLLTLFGLELERYWMWSMDLCAITVVEFRAGRPVLRAHNLTAHLAALDVDREAAAHKAEAEERERSGAQ